MTSPVLSQRLLKLFALVSVVLTVAALYIWRTTGEGAPWLVRAAAASFAAALLVGLIAAETRPRLMLRFLAALFALIAVIALASDISHALTGGGHLSATSLFGHITDLSPSLLAALRSGTIRMAGATAWDTFALLLLSLPTFVIFGLLAALAGYAGRPREEVRIYIN